MFVLRRTFFRRGGKRVYFNPSYNNIAPPPPPSPSPEKMSETVPTVKREFKDLHYGSQESCFHGHFGKRYGQVECGIP